ncbi:PIG-L deacetylase family protein [bacterium]
MDFSTPRPPWLNVKKYSGKTVLIPHAHTDDADWACGGTAARLAAAGAEVIYVVATDGEAGSSDLEITQEELIEIRRGEQRDANDILGVSDTIFLGHQDGRLHRVPDLEEQVMKLVREYKPELVITFDPEWPEHRMHPDHRAIAIATIRSCNFSGLSMTYGDGSHQEPHRCDELLLWGPKKPNLWVNVSKYTYEKLAALAAHRSQMEHLLPGPLHDLVYRLIDSGENPVTKTLPGLIHSSFFVEPFRRYPLGSLLR